MSNRCSDEAVVFGLTHPQARVLRTEQLFPQSAASTLLLRFVCAEATPEVLLAAMRVVVAEFDCLRLCVVQRPEGLVQYVADHVEFGCERFDFTGSNGAILEREWLTEEAARRFEDLSAPLFRIAAGTYFDGRRGFVLVMHHATVDAWTVKLISDRIGACCRSLSHGVTPAAVERPSCLNFVGEEAAYLASKRYQADRRFWLARLDRELTPLDLTRRPLPKHQITACRHKFRLDLPTTQSVRQLADALGVTPYAVLFGALVMFLARYRQVQSLVLGTVVNDRTSKAARQTPGMRVNTLAMHIEVDPAVSADTFLHTLKRQLTETYRHQKYPFGELVSEMRQRGRDLANAVDVVFSYENIEFDLENEWVFSGHEFFPLVVHITERESTANLGVELDYRDGLFAPGELEGFVDGWTALLRHLLRAPQTPVRELALVSEERASQLLEAFNDTSREYPSEQTLAELFQRWVTLTPDAPALAFEAERWTYSELAQRVQALRERLQASGLQPGERVALMFDRGPVMVVALLSVLWAGASYVPIDPKYPVERVRHMLRDSGARLVLTEPGRTHPALGDGQQLGVALDDLEVSASQPWGEAAPVGGQAAACVLYTSGSTGVPKGIELSHSNVSRLVQNTNYIDVQPKDRVLQFSSTSFDGSLFDIYGALTNGAMLVLLGPEDVLDIARIAEVLKRHEVTVALLTTAMLNAVVDLQPGCLAGLRVLLFGGERASDRHVARARQLLPNTQLVNCYGPTENGVISTTYEIPIGGAPAEIPIGTPIGNTQVYLLDAALQPLPVGAVGELYLAGDGLAAGYLNRPELTAEKFVTSDLAPRGRLYRSGDLARLRGDGQLHFVARADRQVKRRGFRIELDAVELALQSYPSIRSAVALLKELDSGERELHAYVVAEGKVSSDQLRRHVTEKLAPHSVPDAFFLVEELPLTTNGKIDLAKVAELELQRLKAEPQGLEITSDTQQAVLDVWNESLGGGVASVSQSFFDAGGNSLKLLEVHSLLQQRYPGCVEVGDLFAHPTIEALAAFIDGRAEPTRKLIVEGLTPPAVLREEESESAAANSVVVQLGRERWEAARHKAQQLGVPVSDVLRVAFVRSLATVFDVSRVPIVVDSTKSGYQVVDVALTPACSLPRALELFEASRGQAQFLALEDVQQLQHDGRVLPAWLSRPSRVSWPGGLRVTLETSVRPPRLRCEFEPSLLSASGLRTVMRAFLDAFEAFIRGAEPRPSGEVEERRQA